MGTASFIPVKKYMSFTLLLSLASPYSIKRDCFGYDIAAASALTSSDKFLSDTYVVLTSSR
jgi:hypothetical protein